MKQKLPKGRFLINIGLGAWMLAMFWWIRNIGIGFLTELPPAAYFNSPIFGRIPQETIIPLSIDGVKSIFLSGIVAGMALTLFIIILAQLLLDLEKYSKIGVRLRIWKRKLRA